MRAVQLAERCNAHTFSDHSSNFEVPFWYTKPLRLDSFLRKMSSQPVDLPGSDIQALVLRDGGTCSDEVLQKVIDLVRFVDGSVVSRSEYHCLGEIANSNDVAAYAV